MCESTCSCLCMFLGWSAPREQQKCLQYISRTTLRGQSFERGNYCSGRFEDVCRSDNFTNNLIPIAFYSHVPVNGGQLQNGVYAANCENCGFFFKFRAKQSTSSSVTFTVNGTSYTGWWLFVLLWKMWIMSELHMVFCIVKICWCEHTVYSLYRGKTESVSLSTSTCV